MIKADGCPDSRHYNAPTTQEIAVILSNDGYGEEVASRDIVLCALQHITETHLAYHTLHYVLLFPLGEDGWHLNIPHSKGRGNVTAMEYYAYRLMVRSRLSPLHLSGRLFPSVCCECIRQNRAAASELHQDQSKEDSCGSLLWIG